MADPMWDTTEQGGTEYNVAVPGMVMGALALIFAGINTKRVQNMPVGKDIGVPVLDKLAEQVRSGSY